MKLKQSLTVASLVGASIMATSGMASADTTLHVFVGSRYQALIQPVLDMFNADHPGVKAEIAVGAQTSGKQQQYLNTVLSAKSNSLDVLNLDVVRPSQYAAAGWTAPLNAELGPNPTSYLDKYLPAYSNADMVNGKVLALPAYADAMFLYYRKDLLKKYNLQPPKTWAQLVSEAKTIQKGEGGNLQGLSFQGAPIEGTVCTFLLPYWSMGKHIVNAQGKLTFDTPAAVASLKLWKSFVQDGVAPQNIAQVATDDTRKDFQDGKVVFAINWDYAWALFEGQADSKVKGKVGVARIPAVAGGENATCLGGWQWAVSAYSDHKKLAGELVKFMSSPKISAYLAIHGSLLPVYSDVYKQADVVKAVPWAEQALPVITGAKSRPVTPQYPQVSEIIRTSVNAVLAGSMSPEQGAALMKSRLSRLLN